MADLPEFVYLITVEGQWPVWATAGDHSSVPEWIEREVIRRTSGENRQARSRAHVWRIPVTGAVEMEVQAATVIPASLRERRPAGA